MSFSRTTILPQKNKLKKREFFVLHHWRKIKRFKKRAFFVPHHSRENKMVRKTWVFRAAHFGVKKTVKKTWGFRAATFPINKNGSKNVSFSCHSVCLKKKRFKKREFFVPQWLKMVQKTQFFSFTLLRLGIKNKHFCSNGPYELWNGPVWLS